jgi:branched-chain amino acid transport system substrate-binding protein
LVIVAGIGYYLITPTAAVIVNIGYIGPLTGDGAYYGGQETQGIDLAAAEINAKSGIKGDQIKVIHEDAQLDATLGTNAITKLITMDKVPAVIGELSSTVTLALVPIAERNKVVLLSEGSNSNKLSGAGGYIFRIYPTNTEEGQKLVELALSSNLTNGAIIYINNDYGTELESAINQNFTKNGGTVAISEGFNPGATDFRTQLTKIKAKNPNVIFLLGYTQESATIVKQSKEIGLKSQFLAADTFNDPEVVDWSGNASEGVIFVVPSFDSKRWQDFNQKVMSKYGNNATIFTAMAYDAMSLLGAAMENSGITSDAIKTGLTQIKDYPGVTGNITFDKNHDVVTRLFSVKIVKGGKFADYGA